MFEMILKILSLISQFFIGIAVLYSARKIARGRFTKSVQDSWNEYNKLVLTSKENMVIDQKYLFPDFFNSTEESWRKNYLSFVLLNILENLYIGRKHGLLEKGYSEESIKDLLNPLLKDEDFYNLSQSRGYSKGFKSYCTELRKNII